MRGTDGVFITSALPPLLDKRNPCDTCTMSLASELKAGLSPLVDLIYPPRCPSCGVAVASDGGLCVDCWSELEPLGAVESEGGDETLDINPEVLAAFAYNDASRDLILKLKHGRKVMLAGLMARMMASQIDDASADTLRLLVPVPLHRLRLWERGFNQAALLAQELAKLGKGDLCVDALVRGKRTPSLGGLGKEERRIALDGAISISASRQKVVQEREILLIDDVYTSGATSSACTQALLSAGAAKVTLVCFARVIEA